MTAARRLSRLEGAAGRRAVPRLVDALEAHSRLEQPPEGYSAADRAQDERTVAAWDAVMRAAL